MTDFQQEIQQVPPEQSPVTHYEGITLKYPGYLCDAELLPLLYEDPRDPEGPVFKLLHTLAPWGYVERDIGIGFETWIKVTKIKHSWELDELRLKLIEGKIPGAKTPLTLWEP